jgi:polyphenol oxidase
VFKGVFHIDPQNVYRVPELEAFEWLVHGFGTRWSQSFGSCRNLATLHQIHSGDVVDASGRTGCLGEGDALIENTPGVIVGIKTADCIPILMVDPVHRAVAAVHAGWRGTVQKIVGNAIRQMERRFSTCAQDLRVAIGPGIGKCCYEVGPEVMEQFREYNPAPDHLDLAEINRRQIAHCGVPSGQIYVANICTLCDPDFHSFRRDKEQAGRMLSVVGVV